MLFSVLNINEKIRQIKQKIICQERDTNKKQWNNK